MLSRSREETLEVGHAICPACGQEIDPEMCWCGDYIKDHNPMWCGHTAVPLGCICGYPREESAGRSGCDR